MSVLITSATSASAHKLKNKLNLEDVLLGDYQEMPGFMLQNKGLAQLPNPASVSYQHDMLTYCLDNGVEAIYVLTTLECSLLFQSVQLFKEYNITIIDAQTYV